MSKNEELTRIIARLDAHFGDHPGDADRWKELRRCISRMFGALALVEFTLREQGHSIPPEIRQRLQDHAAWGFGERERP